MRTLKTAVCMECDAEALLGKLGVRTLAVCQTFKDLITLLGYRPDVIAAAARPPPRRGPPAPPPPPARGNWRRIRR